MPRASHVERQARALCVELARVTDSRPMHWRTVAPIRQAVGLDDASAAVAYAAGQDWLLAEGQPPHSICLTEGGRVMVAKLKRRQARPMAKQRRYSIEIKDDPGKTVIFTPKGR